MKLNLTALVQSLSISAAATVVTFATATPTFALSITQESDSNILLNDLLGSTKGLSNFTVTKTGLDAAFGRFSNDTVFGLGSGIVLSTGNAVDVVGPNNTSGQSGSGNAAELSISFDSDGTSGKLFFQYVFGSEELLEYAGSSFNDSFELLLNGTNLAVLNNGKPLTINNLAASPTGPFDSALIINKGNETQLDAYTKMLNFEGLLNKGANQLVIKIRDVGDSSIDSAVLIKGGTLGVGSPEAIPTPALLPGLIGLGLGVVRKRKSQKSAEA
ncbi:MAG TPA: PTPA-CTERM sorting domain-containing protein [Leptolyngbyaceae cyanobacterium M33_DOE_097]|uniref:PTPA-CTERM sorting domain-containing protein n=1 Tax=Oscillatoriales cyanobacterium SpSt-418 TaxID=2282169 RepID=A0A7C3PCX7_9CYAN|nr:PTPA-CTERM sorting domain-containing protein [Leptolyngbyaceae cyanobacterium M33_DOE_097]